MYCKECPLKTFYFSAKYKKRKKRKGRKKKVGISSGVGLHAQYPKLAKDYPCLYLDLMSI